MSPSRLTPEAKPFYPDQTNTSFQSPHPTSSYPEQREVRFKAEHGTYVQHSSPQNERRSTPMPSTPSPHSRNDNSNMNDFVRYLARRELVATGLLQFNDKPQNYRAWKRSFESATIGLNLTPSEEMDLLLKWLGKDSAEQVEQLRAIHINHPEDGLEMIWERLDQTYGSTEAIEDSLFKRLENFPKITSRDYAKITKLSDLLMELLSAKREGDLPGLALLDTARGVNPIVQKLPFRLQEKWASAGASYKQRNHVPYPPFSFFVHFITQEANIVRDPSFNFFSQSDMTPKTENTVWKSNKPQRFQLTKQVQLMYQPLKKLTARCVLSTTSRTRWKSVAPFGRRR